MLARALDGHQDGGAMWEAFIRPIDAAADAEVTRQNETGTAYMEVLEQHYPGRELARLNDKLFIPAINDSSLERRPARHRAQLGQPDEAAIDCSPIRSGVSTRRRSKPSSTRSTRATGASSRTRGTSIDFWPEIAAKQQRVTGVRAGEGRGDPGADEVRTN